MQTRASILKYLWIVGLVAGLSGCRGEPTGTPAPTSAPEPVEPGTPSPSEPTLTPIIVTTTPFDVSRVPDCETSRTLALGLGLTEFKTEDEMRQVLGSDMLFPDPKTLPSDAHFNKGYYNAKMITDRSFVNQPFRQSTMANGYSWGDAGGKATKDRRGLTVISLNQVRPFEEPSEPHKTITLRGKTAYVFEIPVTPPAHSVQWKEDCRVVSVVGDLPEADIIRIAEALQPGR